MEKNTEEFAFIVVGGGTAGSVIAARLSEDPGTRVLLLEAGSAHTAAATALPSQWPTLLQTDAVWGDLTVPQRANGRRVPLPRGRALGGGSAVNGMNHVRGHRSGYDAWAQAAGADWSFEGLLPCFRRSESTVGKDPALRGTDGPLSVGPADPPHPLVAALLDGAAECGHRRAADISGGTEEGFGWSDLNIVGGRRQSAADAYLTPAVRRTNLTVVTGAQAHRLLISRGRCTGVEYRTAAGPVSVRCSGEVVLTAGTIGTAHLLLLSGIGPGRHLRRTGVEVVADLPGVGENLHDHPLAYLAYRSRRPVPPGANNHGEAFGLVRSRPGLDGPDLQILFIDVARGDPAAARTGTEGGYSVAVSAITPRSRGTIRLASADPGVPPLVDPDYYGDGTDVDTAVRGLRLARDIGESRALDAWRAGEAVPGPATTGTAALRAYVLGTPASYYHPVGTCRMGADPSAVVDGELRLRGVGGLRVADASVIPSIPSANTNATVCAVAERAAELLRYGGRRDPGRTSP
ncbi:GMC family oxidoreductase [Streptomyces sp. NPDC051287]|uniref:GMC family oxidoreductase n=1 Tax=Streptomyces sp. NPDC051287 TaxID=3365648 RepID=UPI0037B08066